MTLLSTHSKIVNLMIDNPAVLIFSVDEDIIDNFNLVSHLQIRVELQNFYVLNLRDYKWTLN